MNASVNIIVFNANDNNSNSFKVKQQRIGETGNSSTKDVEIMIPLKYLKDFQRTLEIPLINSEITIQLTCSRNSNSWQCTKSITKIQNN